VAIGEDSVEASGEMRVRVVLRSTDAALGPVTVTALDHHRRPVGSETREVGTARVVFSLHRPMRLAAGGTHAIEMVEIRAGDFITFVDLVATDAKGDRVRELGFGGMHAPAPLP
jgi:hypothetical protein